ncbi:Tubulin-specific chaperone C [Morus notabilis]|uniref:Tubulin-specific chaperone C n=1 Tax=Morus notabilis TaxID=981085 RepID=W9QDT2_9ROSA|nr:tubulin-folding cofactor C [Morus notabilis]XP_024021828.1 tubulin-folding cofactor C [Morus notabilis]EXB29460.1 Tubulin-specific chaperone C [Morus notabilis]
MADEEDALSSNPNEAPNHSEESRQRKHAALLERLANRHQTRLENSLTRRSADSDSSSSSPSFESTSSFLSRFADSKRSIESRIAQCRLTPTSESTQLKSNLDSISASISDLEKLVAENSYFLPSYEVRSLLKAISDLKQSLESLSSELVPKKKFIFKNKAAKKEKAPIFDSMKEKEPETDKPAKVGFTVPESPGFRNKTGEVLVREFKGSEIGEFTISDLDSCEVRLIGCVRALFAHRLRNCRIFGGPVSASILIEGAEDCVFVIASHQIRIHHVKASDFYLRVRSRPIIEDTTNVRFAPYCLSYEGIDEDLKSAGLNEETGNWAHVDDFGWLRAVQSPNWSILPENDRIGLIKISDPNKGAEKI